MMNLWVLSPIPCRIFIWLLESLLLFLDLRLAAVVCVSFFINKISFYGFSSSCRQFSAQHKKNETLSHGKLQLCWLSYSHFMLCHVGSISIWVLKWETLISITLHLMSTAISHSGELTTTILLIVCKREQRREQTEANMTRNRQSPMESHKFSCSFQFHFIWMYVALSDRAFVLVSTFLCLRTRSTTSMRSLEEVKWRNLNFYNIVDSRLSSKWTRTLRWQQELDQASLQLPWKLSFMMLLNSNIGSINRWR